MTYKLPEGWENKKINDTKINVTDYVANGSFKSLKDNVKYLDEPSYAVLIRLTDYNNGYKGDFRFLNKKTYDFLSKTKLYGDEIIISNVGANTGTVFKCPKLKYKMSLGPNAVVLKIDEKDKEYINNFIYYWFFGWYGQGQMNSIISGSAQPKFNKTNFRELKIPTPSLPEQKVIADTLSALDDKIKNNNKINESLEEQAQAIFKHWFVDFEFPDEDGNPYKSSGGEMVESELGMIPKGWEVVKLGDKFNFVKGKVPKYVDVFEKNAKAYLNKAALDGDWTEIKYGSKNTGVYCEILDVLMMMDGASSSEVFYGYDGLVGSTLSLIETKDDNIREILYMYFIVFNNELKNQNTGSAIPHANKAYIDSIKIAIPKFENKFTSLSETFKLIRVKILSNQQQNQKLSQLRDTILPKLMSGELRIPINNKPGN